jgi:recombination protein RecA
MVQRIKREEGGGNYFTSPKPNIQFISTGCHLLDLALGGGWAEGRIANIVGDKSTGKTLLCIEASANFAMKHKRGRIRYSEAEAAFDEDYARALGMPINRVSFNEEPMATVEDFFDDLNSELKKAVETGDPCLYILDSLDALSDRDEMEREIDKGSYGAAKAKKMSELFRRGVRQLEAANVTLLIVSQVRDKIGVLIGRKTTRTGGRALDFYASQIVYLAQLQTISRTVSKIKRPVGVEIKAKVDKNKVGLPLREAKFEITFGYGIEDEDASLDWLSKECGWSDAKIKTIPRDGLRAAVAKEWFRIEQSFLPQRRKYGD